MNLINVTKNKNFVSVLIATSVALVFLALYLQQSYRVGDGSEYIAMFLGWSVDLRPWLTDAGFAAYDAYLKSGEILGGVPAAELKNAFPALSTIEGQWDFNHFWFYPLAAYLLGWVFTFGQINSPEMGFLLLHAALAFWLLRTGYVKFGRPGLLASLLITITSPTIWFIFAIHTEFWTFTLTTLAVIYLLAGEKSKSAVCLAVASTQNPSFAILAAMLVFWGAIKEPLTLKRPGFWVSSIFAAFISMLHPLYYFSRYGAPTPQSIAGGLTPGLNLDTWYIWFIDPDIGLLPNWPLGALTLLMFLFRSNSRKYFKVFADTFKISARSFGLFAITFSVVSVYAQSGTTNLNSGATPGIARYAIWYLCLFFPMLMTLIEHVKKRNVLYISLVVSATSLFTLVNLIQNSPLKFESYSSPSAQGLFVQRYLSGLYYSPPEIFAERYSGSGEAIWSTNFTAILGPDCRKVLIIRSSSKPILTDYFNCDPKIPASYFARLTEQNAKPGYFYVSIKQ